MIYNIKALAKINLFLQIIGRKKNQTHYLHSFIAFAQDIYDELAIEESALQNSCIFTNNDDLNNQENNNIVKIALDLLSCYTQKFFCIKITKNIPIAAGLGGGSADVGAVLNFIGKLCNVPISVLESVAIAVGTDIISCMHCKPCIVTDDGRCITFSNQKFKLHAVFVNPNKALLTKDVFAQYKKDAYAFSAKLSMQKMQKYDLYNLLKLPNDLEKPAIKLMPEIIDIISIIKQQDHCVIAKMSGSGATCFGIFKDITSAKIAAKKINQSLPEFFVQYSFVTDNIDD